MAVFELAEKEGDGLVASCALLPPHYRPRFSWKVGAIRRWGVMKPGESYTDAHNCMRFVTIKGRRLGPLTRELSCIRADHSGRGRRRAKAPRQPRARSR